MPNLKSTHQTHAILNLIVLTFEKVLYWLPVTQGGPNAARSMKYDAPSTCNSSVIPVNFFTRLVSLEIYDPQEIRDKNQQFKRFT